MTIANIAVASVCLASAGCAGNSASHSQVQTAEAVPAASGPPVASAGAGVNLAGGRCHEGLCTCRSRAGDPAESPAPDEAHKRFEIRLGAGGGPATMTSPTLGTLASGPGESCFYVDVVPGTTHEISFVAREARTDEGVSPVFELAEYGPKGPWWYDVLAVKCAGPGGHCNRDAADERSVAAKTRKRGRIDPCGSSVITHLHWDTSGGTATREMGIFRDFTVSFTLEVKKFATQFAPGSTECVPK